MKSDSQPEPKEKTPKGYEVRTPTRHEFDDMLTKLAKPKKSGPRGPKK